MRRRELPGGTPPPTKTELKRRARSVQELADRLIGAPDELVAGLGLPEKLADAIALARRITSRAALARQRQFVAKQMRSIDCDSIQAALDADALRARREAARFRRAERWRNRLAAEGEAAVADFVAEYPEADRGVLSRLAAAAAAARGTARQAFAGRELFRWIRDRMEAS